MRFVASIRGWIARLFRQRKVNIPHVAAPPISKKVKSSNKDISFGVVTSLPELLRELPDYFTTMKAMRKASLADYNYFSQVGGQVVSETAHGYFGGLPEAWGKGYMPAAGMIYTKPTKKDDIVHLSAMTFRKYKWFEGLELPKKNETIYMFNLYYFDPEKKALKGGIAVLQFILAVSEGGVRVLRSLHSDGRWRIPIYCRYLGTTDGTPAVSYEVGKEKIVKMFVYAISLYTYSGDGILTSCFDPKTGIWASFNIPMTRAPYFFRERVRVKSDSGKTAPIFHSVRPHERLIGDKTVNVKFHFRGLRAFDWQGYSVKVSVAGWHHADMRDFAAAAVDAPKGERKKRGWMDDRETGATFRKHIMTADRKRGVKRVQVYH